MKHIERVQTSTASRSKRLTDLDFATEGQEVNAMAPSHLNLEIARDRPSGKPRPRPRVKGSTSVATSLVAPPPQPTFSLAAQGQHFGFSLPNTSQAPRRQVESIDSLSDGSRPTSRTSTNFSNISHASTAPTSRASSSTGDLDASQRRPVHGFSSRLKMMALASQSGVEAPTRKSRVSSGPTASQPPDVSRSSSFPDPQGQRTQFHSRPQSQPSVIPPSPQFDEFDESASPPHRPTELQRTESFYFSLDGCKLCHGHTLSAVPSPDLGNQPEENVDEEEPIDETSPSEDDQFAEAMLRGM